MNSRLPVIAFVLMLLACIAALAVASSRQDKKADPRVFELRTYTPAPGKMEALLARFRNHTCKLFEKHGMKNIGYWVSIEKPDAEPRLIYILAHKSREAAAESFKAFGADPEWQAARAESEKDGRLTAKVESVYMNPTDFSTIK